MELRLVHVLVYVSRGAGDWNGSHADGPDDGFPVPHDGSEELGELIPAQLLLGGLADQADGLGRVLAIFGCRLLRD